MNSETDSGFSEPEIQALISSVLAEALAKQIRFVYPKNVSQSSLKVTDEIGIYLFKQSKEPVLGKDLDVSEVEPKIMMKKPKLKRRKIDDDSTSEDENTKLKTVAVSADWVMSGGY